MPTCVPPRTGTAQSAGPWLVGPAAEPVDDAAEPLEVGARVGQLILEAHDDLCGGQRVAVVEQHTHACGDGELLTGVAPVAAGGPGRLHHPGAVEAAEERRLHAEQLGRLAHRERREVRVVEPAQRIVHLVPPHPADRYPEGPGPYPGPAPRPARLRPRRP